MSEGGRARFGVEKRRVWEVWWCVVWKRQIFSTREARAAIWSSRVARNLGKGGMSEGGRARVGVGKRRVRGWMAVRRLEGL